MWRNIENLMNWEDITLAEEKVRFQMRIDPDTDRKVKASIPLSNSRSQNEFVEKALRFYCDYLNAQDCTTVLSPVYLSALKATIQMTSHQPSALQADGGDGYDDECAGGRDGDQ